MASRSEYAFPALLATVLIVVGTLPYLAGYWNATPEYTFMDTVGRGAFGTNGYFMLAGQARDGHNLFFNKMTSEELPRVFFNPEWWVFGKVARWTGLSLVAVFHLDRILTAFFFTFSVYFLAGVCLNTAFQRRLATALVTFGAGFGWLLWVGCKVAVAAKPALAIGVPVQNSAEFFYTGFPLPLPPDIGGVTVGLYAINHPHFVRAVAIAVLVNAFLILGERTGQRRFFVLSGLFALARVSIRPYGVPEVYLVFLAYAVLMSIRERRLDKNRIINYAIAAAIPLPQVGYWVWLKAVQALGSSPGPIWTPHSFVVHILWLGLPFLLCFLCFEGLTRFRSMRDSSLLMVLWLMLVFLVEQSYPFYRSGQESAFAGYVIAPVMLAAAGPLRWAWRLGLEHGRKLMMGFEPARFKRMAAVGLVALSMPSNIIVYDKMIRDLPRHPAPHFMPSGLVDALTWLGGQCSEHDLVLTGFDSGQMVPRLAGCRTFMGHYMITPNHGEREALMRRFFGTRGDDAFKRELIRTHGIDYIVQGPLETFPGGIVPAEHPWMVPIHSEGGAAVYAVKGDEL